MVVVHGDCVLYWLNTCLHDIHCLNRARPDDGILLDSGKHLSLAKRLLYLFDNQFN